MCSLKGEGEGPKPLGLGEGVEAGAIYLPDLVMLWVVERALYQLFGLRFVGEEFASVDVELASFFANILRKFDLGHDAVGVGHVMVSSLYALTIPILQKSARVILQKDEKKM